MIIRISIIPKLFALGVLAFVYTAPVQAQEEEIPSAPSSVPTLPPNLTPPSGPPPGPPPELPDFLKNRVRGGAAQSEAEQVQPTQTINPQTGEPFGASQSDRQFRGQPAVPQPRNPVVPQAENQAAAAASQIQEPEEPEEMVTTIVFSDDSALQVLQLLEQLTGKAVLRQQSIPAVKINFNSQGPMTKSEAILAIESLLSLNGIAITDLGERFIKVVPLNTVAQQVPIFITGSTLGLSPSQAVYSKLFKLEYLSVQAEAQPLIQQLMSMNAAGALVPFTKTNSMLITDALVNLQRIEKVLMDADQPQVPDEEVLFFQLTNVKATDLQGRLQALIQNQNSAISRYFINNTTIEADERTNQLIVLTHPSNEPMIANFIKKLDIDVAPVTTSRVFYIKHAKAVDIDSLLEEVITGQQQAVEEANNANTGQNRPQRGNQPNQPNQPQTQTISVGQVDTSGVRFSEFITIVADERSNAIVAYGTKADLDQIESLIDQIDVLLAQVHIEVIIAEVQLNHDEVNGISALNLDYNIADLSGLSGGVTGKGNTTLDPPFTFFGATDTDTVSIALGESLVNSKSRVLSAPVIVTTHNQEATINVSQSRPFITGGITTQDGSVSGQVTNSVQYRDVGIQLKVTPLIGSNGVVQMEIEQIVENFTGGSVDVNGTPQPFIDKREATSFISVTDQQTIVLAGLQQSQIDTADGKIWLLGDLPLIGDWLFSNDTIADARRELMLFIKPYVIYNQKDATAGVDLAIGNLDNGEDVDLFMETQNISAVFEKEEQEQKEELTPKIFRSRGTKGK
ncbi:secretin N-terminal domain-containing protein [Rubellicoccus peritrichatus]|uniref:Secretin N-terminal domain-containing protein n=1 Tax=Rubellicoccus peritrichatus TaxID=3080537 RepID=A0AAQ3LAP8_9BACT|nr:secretin N-terminal domain-containing protein [Puniceicoccus sp. CR14]WOO40033.1 secretin N-terminal domain-containing protein [Puniceicoccus sp. CR14]